MMEHFQRRSYEFDRIIHDTFQELKHHNAAQFDSMHKELIDIWTPLPKAGKYCHDNAVMQQIRIIMMLIMNCRKKINERIIILSYQGNDSMDLVSKKHATFIEPP